MISLEGGRYVVIVNGGVLSTHTFLADAKHALRMYNSI